MVRTAVLAVWTAIQAYSQVLSSSVLQEQTSYTVPGLSGIAKIELADVDGDNSAEVFVSDNHNVVLYSAATDAVLLADTLPSEYSDYEIELADINRDSHIDGTVLVSTWNLTSLQGTKYEVFLYNNIASDPACISALEFEDESTLGIGMFEAVDMNGDGYHNPVIS